MDFEETTLFWKESSIYLLGLLGLGLGLGLGFGLGLGLGFGLGFGIWVSLVLLGLFGRFETWHRRNPNRRNLPSKSFTFPDYYQKLLIGQ